MKNTLHVLVALASLCTLSVTAVADIGEVGGKIINRRTAEELVLLCTEPFGPNGECLNYNLTLLPEHRTINTAAPLSERDLSQWSRDTREDLKDVTALAFLSNHRIRRAKHVLLTEGELKVSDTVFQQMLYRGQHFVTLKSGCE